MYTLVLTLCIIAVVLSPLALDLYLSRAEARLNKKGRRVLLSSKKKGPQLVWASSRTR